MDRLHRGRFFEDGGNGPRLAGCVGGDVWSWFCAAWCLLVGWTRGPDLPRPAMQLVAHGLASIAPHEVRCGPVPG